MSDEIEKGYRYRSPAPETLKRLAEGDAKFNHIDNAMNNLSTDVKLMKKDITTICEKLDDHITKNDKDFEELKGLVGKFLDGCDTRYATKDFQTIITKILWAIGFLIIGGVIAAILRLVLK